VTTKELSSYAFDVGRCLDRLMWELYLAADVGVMVSRANCDWIEEKLARAREGFEAAAAAVKGGEQRVGPG